ncbi:MAG: hypothetical protein JW712_07680 [Dehalococcoidales bacterium]|nr:hypothetical protein [Dehalococcoidales bacterium]
MLSLGLDVSTQSISAIVLDMDSRSIVCEHSLDYCRDSRLNTFGIREEDYILPPESEGEANQPALMFLAALDALLTDLAKEIDISSVSVINTSGQQHGHVYLNHESGSLFRKLLDRESAGSDLLSLLKDSLAWEAAPIWLTSNTAEQAEHMRSHAGGIQKVIELSGADIPLRFTGAVIRRTGQKMPDIYRRTAVIQLISSFIPAVLTGNPNVPTDFGNASGMALMDYRKRDWADELLAAASDGLEGGKQGLRDKLPSIVSPETVVGTIAGYFTAKYGLSPECRILAGSGDNPQSKVLVTGDLLSLGTSIVNMVSTDGQTMDLNGCASAMYDGIGRPFMFGTRTNGVMVWDRLRAMYGMDKKDYSAAEDALQKIPAGQHRLFWQPRNESFPPSPAMDITRFGGYEPEFGADYAALIETTLAIVYWYSKGFTRETGEPLFVTGGARNSREILRRVAAIWNRPVTPIEAGGAALGAAVAGAYGLFKAEGTKINVEEFTGSGLMKREEPVYPLAEDVEAFHKPGGFLDRFDDEYRKLIG